MMYRDFVQRVKNLNYFKVDVLAATSGGNERTLRNQLVLWQKQKKVHRLKGGIYTLNDEERRAPLPSFLISNILYPPSYISLETALDFWGLIPERSSETLAITARKTAVYQNHYGYFRYRSLKKSLFFGFETIQEEGLPVLIAQAEKALLDKIYFDPAFQAEEDYFLEHLRLQNQEGLNQTRLRQFAKRFESRKVSEGSRILLKILAKERKP